MEYLTQVANEAPLVVNARSYGMRVHALWRLRQILLQSQRVTAQVYNGVPDPQEFCERTAEVFHEFAFDPSNGGGLEPVGTILNAAIARIEAAEKTGKSLLGMATGLSRYDRVTGGLHDSELTIIAARPGKGKTSLAAQEGVQVSIEHGPVALFSLEMPKEQIAMRCACAEARVDYSKARIGALTASDWNKLMPALAHINRLPFFIDDTPAISLIAIRAKLRRFQLDIERSRVPVAHGQEKRIRLVIVDYLQLMSASSSAARNGREREVSECSAGLKGIAKDFHCPVIALCQMNRAIEDSDRRPRLRDLRESGAIEQDADNVIFIHTHSKSEPNIVELVIEKQRSGPNDIVCVRFDKQYTRFDNLADGEFDEDEDIGPLAAPKANGRPHAAGCRCMACNPPEAST
jgi:replicative DNA helicase